MEQIKTVNDLKTFSQKYYSMIADTFIEGMREHNGGNGVVTFELSETGELIGLAYNVIDRRKLKPINLSVDEQKSKKSISIYWEIVRDGERINAAKQLFTLPVIGQYYTMN